MAVINHATRSGAPDSGDGKISSNAWNENHTLAGTANYLLGFDGSGNAVDVDPSTIAGASWGAITGTLSDQTDLQTALDAKANLSGATFTGAISASNLSGTNTGDQDLSGYALTSGLAAIATSGSGADLALHSVSLGKIQSIGANTILGNNTGAPAGVLTLSGTAVTAMLDAFTTSLKGLTPASGGGTTNFLRADGTWAAPAGGGTTTNALTFNASGGAASGSTFNGSAAVTVDYSTVGAQPTTSLHPGYISGNWYLTALATSLSAGSAMPGNSIRLMPFSLFRSITVAALAARVTTLGTGNCQLAIYGHNASTGKPTGAALVSTSSISTGAVGNISANVTAQATLGPGIYWMAVNTDNATVVFQTIAAGDPLGSFLIGSATLNNVISAASTTRLCIAVTQTFGTWPDLTSATMTESTGGSQAVLMMKAA